MVWVWGVGDCQVTFAGQDGETVCTTMEMVIELASDVVKWCIATPLISIISGGCVTNSTSSVCLRNSDVSRCF